MHLRHPVRPHRHAALRLPGGGVVDLRIVSHRQRVLPLVLFRSLVEQVVPLLECYFGVALFLMILYVAEVYFIDEVFVYYLFLSTTIMLYAWYFR